MPLTESGRKVKKDAIHIICPNNICNDITF